MKNQKIRAIAASNRAMECWNRMILPMKRALIGAAARLSLQNSGTRKLRKEVSSCEYEDVHVMWEMLRKTDREIARCPPLNRRRNLKRRRCRWVVLDWVPYNICATI